MAYRCNTRNSFSKSTTFAALLLLSVVIQSSLITAQWTQTLGWGGAGNGKRSSDFTKVAEIETRVSRHNLQCHPNTFLINTIALLIKKEKKRLQSCKTGTSKIHDAGAFYDYGDK